MPKRDPTDPGAQAEHARKFAQICRNLEKLAGQLVEQHPDFGVGDFGRAFQTTAIGLLLSGLGEEGTAQYLRRLASGLEAGEPTVS
jgi:hypothetical protein